MKMKVMLLVCGALMAWLPMWAQVQGKVYDLSTGQPLPFAMIFVECKSDSTPEFRVDADSAGRYVINMPLRGTYQFRFFPGMDAQGFHLVEATRRELTGPLVLDIGLDSLRGRLTTIYREKPTLDYKLGTVTITDHYGSVSNLRAIDGMGIYAAKKTELIYLDRLPVNLATNNARQIYARIAGLNIWESDGGGLQLGIGGRGLSPNRSANFNIRQNGYDIAADALGYPESYYTPPSEAVYRIEVVRGAASLQFGTQFGGLVNFQFRQGPPDKKADFTFRQTAGSFGLFSSFNSVGGTVGRLNYYAFYQGKRGDGWRANSRFRQHTAFAGASVKVSKALRIGLEYTWMDYLAQQPGGLTDAAFAQDPRQSLRARNWFAVNWNLAALTADLRLGARTRLNMRNFGLLASRQALGFLGSINRIDPGTERDLIQGTFANFGNETRLLHKYDIGGRPAAFVAGVRLYRGRTESRQGFANAEAGPDFQLLNPGRPELSDYTFPSTNIALFAEHIIPLNDRLSLTPGVRWEYIQTASDGEYRQRVTDLAGNVIFEQTFQDQQQLRRNIPLGGIGLGYRLPKGVEFYGNFSQNYRAITFNDIRVVNPNFKIDPDLQDERGYSADLGMRGSVRDWLSVDASLFLLDYRNRIGQVLQVDTTTFQYFRYRTNVAASRTLGLEWYAEADLTEALFQFPRDVRVSVFTNFAYIHARYLAESGSVFAGKVVELAPPVTLKAGTMVEHKSFGFVFQFSHTAAHFSDATNATFSPNAVEGTIPAYQVMDVSGSYTWRFLRFEAGVNNLLDQRYYTRRAVAYPGPGILPSDGRSVYFTLQCKL
jgi:Fe(3+) dicitrate transport protein